MNIKKYILPFLLVTVAVVSALFVNSCDIKSPTEGLEVRLNTFERETLVGVYFYDAITRNSISENVTVTFTGENSTKIVDETNDSKTKFTAENGILLFAVKDGVQISESSPFKVTVKLEAAGFETKTEVIEILSKGSQSYDLFMINETTVSANYKGSGTVNTDNSGTTSQNLDVTTGDGTSIDIPAGTQIKTQTGTPLTGNLNVNVTAIPISAQNVYVAPQNLSLSSNKVIGPAASIYVSIKGQNGNSSSNSVNISLHGIVNPRTGNEYQSGDPIGFFKLNEASGIWEKIGAGNVTAATSKNGLAKISKTNIIGGSVVAGSVIIVGNEENTCEAVLNVTNIPDGFNKSSLRFFNAQGKRMGPSNSGSNFFFEIPSDGATVTSVRINADLNDPFNTGTELGSNISLSCGSSSTSLTFPTNLAGAKFDIQGICTSKDPVVVISPNASFSYRKLGSQTWQIGTLSNGKATITGLTVGATYEVSASFRGNSGNAQVKIVNASAIEILQVTNPENLLSADVDASTTPPTVNLKIDIGHECD